MTGLEPRTHFSITSSPIGLRALPVADYVRDMAEVYDSTPRFVRAIKTERLEEGEIHQARHGRTSQAQVGDFVLVLRPQFMGAKTRPGAVSKKLMHRVFDDVYQVHHLVSESSVILKKASDGGAPSDFSNPINIERLIPAVAWYVSEPAGGARKVLELLQDDEATWRRAEIVGYGYGGTVEVQYADAPPSESTQLDLTKEQYRWVI